MDKQLRKLAQIGSMTFDLCSWTLEVTGHPTYIQSKIWICHKLIWLAKWVNTYAFKKNERKTLLEFSVKFFKISVSGTCKNFSLCRKGKKWEMMSHTVKWVIGTKMTSSSNDESLIHCSFHFNSIFVNFYDGMDFISVDLTSLKLWRHNYDSFWLMMTHIYFFSQLNLLIF